jgi:hypothetical protein
MKEDRKKTVIEAFVLIAVLAVVFVGLWALAEYIENEQKVEPIEQDITVSLRISGDGWSVEYLNVDTKNNTVFKILLECKEKHNISVNYIQWQGFDAVFVNSINGTQNGDGDMWWQYYVNNIYGEIASDKKEIFDGDIVEWRFEEPGQKGD